MSGDSDEYESEAIGWNAIDAALEPVYGTREPKHFGTVVPFALGGQDPLQGISAYKNLEPAPHYHFVTYGFTELYEKESDDPDISGYGFELTFRLACAADDSEEPPMWPLSLLQNIARYVFSSGNAFDERHHMTLNGPIALDEETDITAILLVSDPQLSAIETANGSAKFLQIVGLCEDEYGLIQQGYFDPIADRVSDLTPLAITDIHRPSILQDESILEEITSEEPKDLQAEVFGTVVEWDDADNQLQVQIAATLISRVKAMLKGRVAQNEHAVVYGKGSGVAFEPGEANDWVDEDGLLIVSLTSQTATALADKLQAERGNYAVDDFPRLRIEVVPIEIKDAEGKVVKTVG